MTAKKWDKGKFIQGIYNYCDRWCERCAWTARCFLFYQDSIRRARHESQGEDPNDIRLALEDVEQNVRDTIDLLQKEAAEMGIELAEVPLSPGSLSKEKREKRTKHPLHIQAHRFANATHKFLETLSAEIHIEQRKGGSEEELEEIQDCFEVLSWYHMQIAVKIDRALQSRDREMALAAGSLRDSDGSAKVAHIGLIKMMDAMMKIHQWNSSWNSDLMPLLNGLYELVQGVDQEFPGHQTFKRPGFDE
jgi:flagellar biosynthesis chaperone FliJ